MLWFLHVNDSFESFGNNSRGDYIFASVEWLDCHAPNSPIENKIVQFDRPRYNYKTYYNIQADLAEGYVVMFIFPMLTMKWHMLL